MAIRIVLKNKEQVEAKARSDIARLNAQKSESTVKIARYLQAQARLKAPFRSGKLANSIKVSHLASGGYRVLVTAKSKQGFAYPKWVNQDPGFKKLTYPNGGPFGLKPGDTAVYGSIPGTWRWTGEARFFDQAKELTKENWKSIALPGFNKALGAKIV